MRLVQTFRELDRSLRERRDISHEKAVEIILEELESKERFHDALVCKLKEEVESLTHAVTGLKISLALIVGLFTLIAVLVTVVQQ